MEETGGMSLQACQRGGGEARSRPGWIDALPAADLLPAKLLRCVARCEAWSVSPSLPCQDVLPGVLPPLQY